MRQVRHILGIKKVGHAGTLDPLAEGVLVVLTEQDTKKQDSILMTDKEYIAQIGFGIFSETYDLEMLPKVVEIPSLAEIKSKTPAILQTFLGTINQQVPEYSDFFPMLQ